MTKSHVGMGHSLCPVCGVKHDEVVLLHRRFKQVFDEPVATGWAMCPEHKRLEDEGYIALIGVTNRPTGLNDADRTGHLAHIRREAWEAVFNTPPPPGPIAFAGGEVFTAIAPLGTHPI